MYKSKYYNVINLILNYLFFITIYFFRNNIGSIEVDKNFNFLKYNINDSFEEFNFILLFYYIILNFVNNQLNNINVIILLLDFDAVLEISINIYIPNSNVCIDVNSNVNNVTQFKDLMLLCGFNFDRYFDWYELKGFFLTQF